MEGSLVDEGSDTRLSGRGTVTWTVTSGQVMDCAPQATTSPASAELTGDREGQVLTLDIAYPPAAVALQTFCVGRDGGIAQGGMPSLVEPAPVTIVMENLVAARRMNHPLRQPEPQDGTVVVLVWRRYNQ